MNRRIFCTTSLAVMALASTPLAAADDQITFHFYGALDCPPCMAFKRNHLADVQAEGASLGFVVEENIIDKTRDVPNTGVYGDRDPILRLAAPQLEYVYPPIFFVSRSGEIVSVHGHEWQAALEEVRRLAGQT